MKFTAGTDNSEPLGEHVVAGLRQCGLHHSARIEEQPRTDLRVRQPIASEPRDLPLLRSQLIASLDPALAYRLASRQQLTPGTLGERLRTHVKKQPVFCPKLIAGVLAPPREDVVPDSMLDPSTASVDRCVSSLAAYRSGCSSRRRW